MFSPTGHTYPIEKPVKKDVEYVKVKDEAYAVQPYGEHNDHIVVVDKYGIRAYRWDNAGLCYSPRVSEQPSFEDYRKLEKLWRETTKE